MIKFNTIKNTDKKRTPHKRSSFHQAILEILLNTLANQGLLVADGDGELDAVLLAEAVQPIQELLSLEVALAADDLGQAVDEDVGDVIVAGDEAAYKAFKEQIYSPVKRTRLNT